MKRNRERYAYPEISLPKSGTLHQLLTAESEMLGQSLAQTILTRLALSYNLIALPVPSVSQENSLAPMVPVAQARVEQARQQEPEDEPAFDMDAALANADLFGV